MEERQEKAWEHDWVSDNNTNIFFILNHYMLNVK